MAPFRASAVLLAAQLAAIEAIRSSSNEALAGSAAGTCPRDDLAHWRKALGCGNNGCVLLVEKAGAPGDEAVAKVAWSAARSGKEAEILGTLSNLGDPWSDDCVPGTLNSAGKPCTISNNFVKIYADATCSRDDFPPEAAAAMTAMARKLQKTAPDMKADMPVVLMERLHSDLSKLSLSRTFNKEALILQILFAYHAGFKASGFAHNDANKDNFAVRCLGTFNEKAQTCTWDTAARGDKTICLGFEADGGYFCFKLSETDGTEVVIIDFGLSKLKQKTASMADRTGVSRLAQEWMKTTLDYQGNPKATTAWSAAAHNSESLGSLWVPKLPEGALVYGF